MALAVPLGPTACSATLLTPRGALMRMQVENSPLESGVSRAKLFQRRPLRIFNETGAGDELAADAPQLLPSSSTRPPGRTFLDIGVRVTPLQLEAVALCAEAGEATLMDATRAAARTSGTGLMMRVGSAIPTASGPERRYGISSMLVELKARFDEENNIVWARQLERAGVHVVYGVVGLKTHAKMSLVVRREGAGIRCYFHLGTGNYNPATARIYGDIGFFGCDPELAADMTDLFNALTGYSLKTEYRKLLVAPGTMRRELLVRIDREIERHREHGDGYLAFKMNGLVDRDCIEALYRASQAGVHVELQVRGICCLRPGVEGLSENITVTSLVGRFLEHGRLYYFRHGAEGGGEELLLGSADLMPRNLDGRVEVLFPVQHERLRRALRDDILFLHLRDNVKAHRLLADGRYAPIERAPSTEPIDSQRHLLLRGGGWRWED